MLSILLPVYNYDVWPLVRALSQQLRASEWPWELRVYDDASSDRINVGLPPDLAQETHLVYRVLPTNLGRAAIRNLLAKEAAYDYLLFLDADGEIPESFILNYSPFLHQSKIEQAKIVVNGGRCYDERSIRPDQMLHWYYGRKRESPRAAKRQQKPYEGFQTNNFLAPKALIAHHPFDEHIQGYGHEDTLWGYQLAATGYQIIHIDNAVAHRGLETASTFLEKQAAAVANLRHLQATYPELETRLSRFAKHRQVFKQPFLAAMGYLSPHFMRELSSSPPGSLYYLDALKLYWYWRS